MIESTWAACGACAVDRCEVSKDHGPGEASDLLRGGLGGPGLGLDVLEDCAPSPALLLLVGHDFSDCEALLARLRVLLLVGHDSGFKHPKTSTRSGILLQDMAS